MTIIEKLRTLREEASPRILPQHPAGFDFEIKERNRAFYKKQIKKLKETIEEDDHHIIFRTGSHTDGWFIGYDKDEDIIYYIVNYKQQKKKLSGNTLTQILLWRLRGNKHSQGITRKMFFDILLPRTGTMMSDAEQTPLGKGFWKDILAMADMKGLPVGVVDFNSRKIIRHKEGQSVSSFLEENFDDQYGKPVKFEAKRFLVGPVPITK